MTPELKRFHKHFKPVADAIASLDLDQEDRERVAQAVADGLDKATTVDARGGTSQDTKVFRRGWKRGLFVLLASDPLIPCAGWDADGEHHDCPNGTVIRIGMHNRDPADGRAESWKRRAPYGTIRCGSCGSMHFNPEYRQNVLAREEQS